jgi:AcrR family transcriptional regulator
MEIAYDVHMTTSTPQRRRKPRGSITADGILDASEALAAESVDAITVRAVTARLEASPMAFYRHFATKDALVDALLDRVLGRFEPPPATDDWVVDLEGFAVNHRRLLTDHPWAINALFANPNPGLNAARIGEEALRILDRGGLRGEYAVVAFSAIIALNYGWSGFGTRRQPAGEDADDRPVVEAQLRALPADAFPLTASVAAAMSDYGSDTHYRAALRALLAGVDAARSG